MIQNLESSSTAATTPGIRKAAILMIILGDQISGEILRNLDVEEVQAIGQEVARINSISPDQAEAVLEEFYQMSMAREYVLKGGIDYAKRLLDPLEKPLEAELASFDNLHRAEARQLRSERLHQPVHQPLGSE